MSKLPTGACLTKLLSYRNKLECSHYQSLPTQLIIGGKGKEPILCKEFQKGLLSGRLQSCLHILE